MPNSFRECWKGYYEMGLMPFPASKRGKNPIVRWKGIQLSVDILTEWEDQYSDSNVWVLLGDSFVVIDPDGPGAEEFVKSLNLPPCPTSDTGNRSKHRFFKISSPVKPLKIQNGDGTFLELRTGNMGVLVPPSIHPESGKPYSWIENHSPQEIGFPELPREAYERIRSHQKGEELGFRPAHTQSPFQAQMDIKRYLDYYGISYQIKQDGHRIIYAFDKCLFSNEHTTRNTRGDSGIIQGPDGKLGYHCFHNHCTDKTWHDARKVISKGDSIKRFFRKDQGDFAPRIQKAVLTSGEFKAIFFPIKKQILSPWVSEQSLIMVSGFSGAGKSWFAYSVCYAITRGREFGPWQTITPVPCLYIDGEMSGQDIQSRIDLLENLFGEEKEPLYILSDFYAHYLGLPKADLKNPEYREVIKKDALRLGVKLIVLDNLSSLCPGIDENLKQEWDPINQWLLKLRFEGISVMLLHHTNKQGGQRGTSGREDNLDISIRLEKPFDYTQEEGCRFITKFSKHRIKNSDLPLIADIEFHLIEEDGRLSWVCKGANKKKKDRNKAEILKLLSEGVRQKDIAARMGISPGQISKVRKELMSKEYLSEDDEITPKGDWYLDENGR